MPVLFGLNEGISSTVEIKENMTQRVSQTRVTAEKRWQNTYFCGLCRSKANSPAKKNNASRRHCYLIFVSYMRLNLKAVYGSTDQYILIMVSLFIGAVVLAIFALFA